MKIIFKNQDNSIGIVTPTDVALSFATIEQIAQKDVPAGRPYWIVDSDTIPVDRTFRDAWELPADMRDPDGFGGELSTFPEEVLS